MMKTNNSSTRRNITKLERSTIFKVWKNKCAYCKGNDGPFAIDHIIPVADGGTCDIENLCLSCVKCNSMKSATRLPKMYEGLLLSVAKRKEKKITKILKRKEKKITKILNRGWAERPKADKRLKSGIYIPASDGGFWATDREENVAKVILILDMMLSKNLLTIGFRPKEWLVCEDLNNDFFKSLQMEPNEVRATLFRFIWVQEKFGRELTRPLAFTGGGNNLTESWRPRCWYRYPDPKEPTSVSFARSMKSLLTFLNDMKR